VTDKLALALLATYVFAVALAFAGSAIEAFTAHRRGRLLPGPFETFFGRFALAPLLVGAFLAVPAFLAWGMVELWRAAL
jgi:hypothetical protein